MHNLSSTSLFQVTNDEYHNVETLIIHSYDHVIDIKGHQRKKEARMLPPRELAYLANLQEMVELLDGYEQTTVGSIELTPPPCFLIIIVHVIKN